MEALRTYLADTGKTQAEFARELGLRQSTVSRWINSDLLPGLQTALAIDSATAGKVPVASWARMGSSPKSAHNTMPKKAAKSNQKVNKGLKWVSEK